MSKDRARGSNFGVSINRTCKGELQNDTLFVILRALLHEVSSHVLDECNKGSISFPSVVRSGVSVDRPGCVLASLCRDVLRLNTALSVLEANQRKKTRNVSVSDFSDVVRRCVNRLMVLDPSVKSIDDDYSDVITPALVDNWGGVLGRGYPPLVRKILQLYERVFSKENHFLTCITLYKDAFQNL